MKPRKLEPQQRCVYAMLIMLSRRRATIPTSSVSLSLSLARSLSLPSRYKISACLYAIWPTRAAGCAKLGGREETADCDGKEVQLQSSGLQTKFYGSNDAKNEFKLYENCIINGNSRGGRNQKQQHLFPHLRGPQQ